MASMRYRLLPLFLEKEVPQIIHTILPSIHQVLRYMDPYQTATSRIRLLPPLSRHPTNGAQLELSLKPQSNITEVIALWRIPKTFISVASFQTVLSPRVPFWMLANMVPVAISAWKRELENYNYGSGIYVILLI